MMRAENVRKCEKRNSNSNLISSVLRHRVGKITENKMKSIWGLMTLYVTLISTHDATYARLSLCTSSEKDKGRKS